MAVVGDNRGGSDSRVAQRPDGAWSFEDARRRREQRQAGPTASAHLRSGEADEDLSALALSLADSLTIDGTPLSQLDIHQDLDASTPERPADDAPTAEEIMRALEAEQRAARATSDTGSLRTAHSPRSARSPHRPSTRRRPHHRRLLPRSAVGDRLLPPRRRPRRARGPARVRNGSEPRRASNSRGRLRCNSSNQRTDRSSDEQLPRRGTRRRSQAQPTTSPDHSHVPAEAAPSPAGTCPQLNIAGRSPSQSTSTASTTGASDSTGTTERISQSSSSPSSSSTPSGSSQPPPTNQSHTAPHSNSSSSSATQSKATLRSLVTGAGSCSCQ